MKWFYKKYQAGSSPPPWTTLFTMTPTVPITKMTHPTLLLPLFPLPPLPPLSPQHKYFCANHAPPPPLMHTYQLCHLPSPLPPLLPLPSKESIQLASKLYIQIIVKVCSASTWHMLNLMIHILKDQTWNERWPVILILVIIFTKD